jgi:hypothetical protein
MRGSNLIAAVVLTVLVVPGVALATDCGAPGKAKIFDRTHTKGKATISYRSGRAFCVDKGAGGPVANLTGSFDIAYIDAPGSARGAFVMPSPWYLNKDNKAKYLNRNAPSGGGVKIAGFRQNISARVSTKSLGDGPQLNILSGPPGPSGVLAIATINNATDGTSTRICTRWSVADGSILNWQPEVGGLAARLLLYGGVPSACDVAPIPTTTSTSTTSTTSTSTSSTTSTSTSSTTTTSTSIPTTTSTSTTTTTTLVLEFVTSDPSLATASGVAKNGGSGGTTLKILHVGGLNLGGGCNQNGGACGIAEGPTPGGSSNLFKADCSGGVCSLSSLTAVQTGSLTDCSAAGCSFGTFLPISNTATSTCVRNVFAVGGTGTLDLTTGAFTGSVPLTSNTTLTGNGTSPCPLCLGGTPLVVDSGTCDHNWTDSSSNHSSTQDVSCTPTDTAGHTYDCVPFGADLGGLSVDLTPFDSGTVSMDTGGTGNFCGQGATEPGSIGCFATHKSTGMVCDYIEEDGIDAAGISIGGGPVSAQLVSVFCVPPVGGVFGGLINGAADLPGPGATALPGTLELR